MKKEHKQENKPPKISDINIFKIDQDKLNKVIYKSSYGDQDF